MLKVTVFCRTLQDYFPEAPRGIESDSRVSKCNNISLYIRTNLRDPFGQIYTV